jgi:hypothetical protein
MQVLQHDWHDGMSAVTFLHTAAPSTEPLKPPVCPGACTDFSRLTCLQAFPRLYNMAEWKGCQIATHPYGGHGAPQADQTVTMELTDASGKAVTGYAHGGKYSIKVKPYVASTLVNAWVHANQGAARLARCLRVPPLSCDGCACS